jgi:hypothetical protein
MDSGSAQKLLEGAELKPAPELYFLSQVRGPMDATL